MFSLNLKDEEIIMKISARKIVTNKDVVANFIGNLLTRAGGDIADQIKLILTKDTLFVEYIGHAAIGYGEEIRKITKISLKDLNSFNVTSREDEELIKIESAGKELFFIRDNSNKDNLALAMSKVINEIKLV